MRHHAAIMETDDIAHGFYGRSGGVSTGIFTSLNCGPGSDDAPDAIYENRARVVKNLSGAEHPLITLHQVHSPDVVTVTAPWEDRNGRPRADAMVTRLRNIALGILTADCCPILLADHDTGVIGAVHAGWRGALAGVIPNTIKAMRDIGAKVANIRAAIGPTIQQSSYEVGADVRDAFTNANSANTKFFIPSPCHPRGGEAEPGDPRSRNTNVSSSGANGLPNHGSPGSAATASAPRMTSEGSKYLFDLPGFAAHQLMQSNVQIYENLGMDTYPAANDFFSYRRGTHENDNAPIGGGNYGRQISAIILR